MQPAKQDIINRIKQVNNILVTVKASPSVDELSAALGLTIALNNFGKHATAVFSGQIPNAMSFLKPQKIFENDVHSLRDFIISLNKEKADKLRFAKDGEIVKIYITPYKSTITSQDLTYEEGDFNVEMVLAIGISTQEELDSVIAAHGRILHEATVATINPGAAAGQLGSINWSEVDITSASAMVMTLLQELGLPTGISPEIATALLTGIVAGTDRFSNTKTTPKIMELSAQLMSSGADHQLVTSSIGSSTVTQPANLSLNQTPTPAPTIEPAKDQEISLDLHTQTTPEASPTAATNVAPMVTSSPEPVAAPAIIDTPVPAPTIESSPMTTPEVSTEISHDQNNSADQSSFNEALNSVLPQPVDATQAVLPPNLLPPAPEAVSSFEDVPNTASPATPPITEPAQTDKVGSEADKILSEIDDIYSSQPFDPANNPRSDLGANTVALEDDATEEPLPSSVLAVDTSVQQDQATSANLANATPLNLANPSSTGLPAIPDAKQETVTSSDLLGDAPAANKPDGVVPGIQMPSVNVPPPPPPPPIEGVPTFTPTIDFSEAQKE
jgi:hypothetical protein